MMLLQKAVHGKAQSQFQSRIPAHCRQNAVRLFLFNNPLDDINIQRLDIDPVGKPVIRHNGRRIGIDQNGLKALLLQCTKRLRPGIIKFRRTADHRRAGTDH